MCSTYYVHVLTIVSLCMCFNEYLWFQNDSFSLDKYRFGKYIFRGYKEKKNRWFYKSDDGINGQYNQLFESCFSALLS